MRRAREPEAAVDELKRPVHEVRLVSCMTDGNFLDHGDFAPVRGPAQVLGARSTPTPESAFAADHGGLLRRTGRRAGGVPHSAAPAGWRQEALRCLRMIADGVLDRSAQLQIAVGHPSKGLSFYGWQVGADSPAF